MANSEPNSVSPFPLPPMQYVNKYTDENVRHGRAPKPPPPMKDSYWMFGSEYKADDHIVRPLESQSLLRLHPHNYDHKRELKKLNFSILVNFLDLLDVLVKAPSSCRREEKVEDLTLLFIHMHHLINEFRPHQARETLRVMLEKQKQQRLEQAKKIEKCNEQVREILNVTVSSLPDDSQLQSKLLFNKNLPIKTENLQYDMGGYFPQQIVAQSIKSEPSFERVVKQEIDSDMEVDSDVRDEMMCNIVDAMN